MKNAIVRLFHEPKASENVIRDPETVRKTYRYWQIRMFIGTFLGYAIFYFCRNNLSSALPGIAEEFHYTNAQLGLLATLLFWTYAIGKFVHGVLADRANVRTFMAIGLLISAGLNFVFSLGTSLVFFAAVWAMNGWFQSTGWPPCAKTLTHWYGMKRRGLIWGLWSSSHQVGGAVIVWMAAALAQAQGWRAAFTVPAVIAAFMAVLLLVLLRDRPAELGLPEIGNMEAELHGQEELREPVWVSLKRHVFTNKWIWILGFQNLCVYIVRYGTLVWTIKYLVEVKQSSVASAGAKTAVLEFMGIFGGLAAGWLSDRVRDHRSRLNVIYFLLLAVSVHFFRVVPSGNISLQIVLLGAIGFLIYGPQLLVGGPCTADLVPRKAAASATGFVGMFGYIGASLMAGFGTGKLIDVFGWDSAFYLWTAMAFAGGILAMAMWNVVPAVRSAK